MTPLSVSHKMSEKEMKIYSHECEVYGQTYIENNNYKCGRHQLYHLSKEALDYHLQVIKHKK